MADETKAGIYGYEPLFGGWTIEEEVGEGSYGTVYRVSKTEMGRKYISAVKLITVPSKDQFREARDSLGSDAGTLRSYFEDIVQTIIREVEMLHSLSGNANILNYHDHTVIERRDRTGWDILIRMEFIKSLPEYLRQGQMTREDVVRLGIDICNALELCGKKGIIHRDIKDDNIFVSDDGVFKLGDFGIARELSKSGRAASMRGTPLYMAPEVYRGEKYDASVDIYSLGLVLYKLLNRSRMPLMPPWPEKVRFTDNEQALESRLAGSPLPPPVMASGALANAVLKACAHRPEDRYRVASGLRRDLEDVLSGMGEAERSELVTPPPISLTNAGATAHSGTVGIGMEERQPSKAIFAQTKPETDRTMGLFAQNENQASRAGGGGGGSPQPQQQQYQPQQQPQPQQYHPQQQPRQQQQYQLQQQPQPKAFPGGMQQGVSFPAKPTAMPAPAAAINAPRARRTHGGAKWWISGAAVAVVAAVFVFVIINASIQNSAGANLDDTPRPTRTAKITPAASSFATENIISTVEPTSETTDHTDKTASAVVPNNTPAVSVTASPQPNKTTPATVAPKATKAAVSTPKPTKAAAATPKPTKAVATTPKPESKWSDWVAALPSGVDSSSYTIETDTQYRYSTASVAVSDWSAWQQSQPSGANICSTEQQHRVRSKEYTTSTNSSLGGWAQYGSPSISYGSWSGWSTSAASPSSTLDVETRQVSDPVYSTVYHYNRWKYKNNTDGKIYYSYAQYMGAVYTPGTGVWEYKDTSSALGIIAYVDGRAEYSGIWFNQSTTQEQTGTTSHTEYRTRSITTTYNYWRWSAWSGWSAGSYSGSTADKEIENQYRYKTSTTTWSAWSEWVFDKHTISDSSKEKEESRTVYRYKKK